MSAARKTSTGTRTPAPPAPASQASEICAPEIPASKNLASTQTSKSVSGGRTVNSPVADPGQQQHKVVRLKTIVALTPPGLARRVLNGVLADEQAALAALNVPHDIVVTPETTPSEALQMAYLSGHKLHAAGMTLEGFVLHLNQRILTPHGGDGLLPFLRVGFAAGYFKKPMPDVTRIAARCVPGGAGQRKRGRKPRAPEVSAAEAVAAER